MILVSAAETVLQAGAAAGLPTVEQTCPYCDVTGPCQELVDHPTVDDAPKPYGCPACDAEFAA